ncbi:MAG: SPFH domain-containing protein [Ruminococcus sp.]|nr:SPFH domain-containing protein [Ruminococcus sp.]
MGLIQAMVVGGISTAKDTWKEFFYCEALPADVLAVKGKKQTGKFSSNKGNDNIITNGSKIAVADGQCMIIVDQGQVVEICAVPGEYTYDMSTEPGLFSGGGFGRNVIDTLKKMWERVGYGGDTAHDQRIYYFNTKEIMDNKFGTQNPVPFRVTYDDLGKSFTVGVRCNGTYSYKLTDPMLFYQNVCGNFSDKYTRSSLDNQLKSEFLNALQPAFAKISASGIRYDQLPGYTLELCDALNDALATKWKDHRGLSVSTISVNSVTISKEDEDRIKKTEDTAWNRDARNAAATLVEAQAGAMHTAAGNQGGAAMGFFGMNMAQQAGGLNAQNLFNMGGASAPAAGSWTCSCGKTNTGNFCADCGKSKPAPAGSWTCSCGASNTGKFCAECGKPKPADAAGWTCSCGAVNKGKFCAECGKPKPAGAPLYRCDKCGWEPADPFNPPKFCAECGDPFNDGDIVK